MMCKSKSVLLIGGGGTLGTYTAYELLELGHSVDVICLEDKKSENQRLQYYKEYASTEFLQELFANKHYDGIVNFIHYEEVEEYKPMHKLLIENTEHLIFLSSYRVYSDLEKPITEETPMLLDISSDEEFLQNEKYAISKAKCEKFLRSECEGQKWTIVRPVISFSERRLDLIMCSGRQIVEKTKAGETIFLPKECKDMTAGLDWSGNTGKIIANLLFKKETYGEAYTITSAQGLKWSEVADIYTELIGAKFRWVDMETYIKSGAMHPSGIWALKYDRMYDRKIDNSKVLHATNLQQEDFTSIRQGIQIELAKVL